MNKPAAVGNASIFRHMLRGSFWALLMRWSVRLVGLVSTMVLARLLTPQDFGIVAMGTLVLGFLALFSEIGVDGFLIRAREATPELCNTGWTIKIVQGFLVGLLLVVSAPLAVHYFREPRLMPVFWLLGASAAVAGFENIGMTLVRKELDFARDFRFTVYKRLINFVVTLPLAFILRSYWALVIGIVCSAVLAVPLSYRMHPYRPRLGLTRAREMLTFGAAMLLTNVGRFFNDQADVLVVGRVATTAAMGAYNVAAQLASMATREIVAPIARALLPAYARVAEEPELLKDTYLKSLSAIALLCLPLGIGLCVVSADAVPVLLGDKWLAVIPALRWLAIYALLTGVTNGMIDEVFIVVGRQWLGTALRWVRVALLVPGVAVAGAFWGVAAVPIAATCSVVVFLPVVLLSVTRVLRIDWRELAGAVWRPTAAALIMAAVLRIASPMAADPFSRLLCALALGSCTYLSAIFVFWWASGRPAGIEAVAFRAVAGVFARAVAVRKHRSRSTPA